MRHSPVFEPKDPDWEAKVRASFVKQGAMGLIGAQLSGLRPGWCEIRVPWREQLTQQHGFFHAGIIATAVDSAAGYAGFTLMPAGSSVLSVEFKINMLSPGDGEVLIATGEVIKAGKSLVITRGEGHVVKGGKITQCVLMQQTLMTMHNKPEKEETICSD